MSTPIYAVGDIHGQLEQLETALERIEADGGPEAQVVFLGDYVDRGPDSRGVIERIRSGIAEGRPWRAVLGNHDRMFLRYVESGRTDDPRIKSGLRWLHPRLGGQETLMSYAVDPSLGDAERLAVAQAAVPSEHLDFLRERPLYLRDGPLLFVHAGIRPGVPLMQQDEDDLVWIREGFLEVEEPFPWLVVHGHTALDWPVHHGNRVNLDGGAGYGRELVPAVFERRDCWLLTSDGRVRL